MIEPTLFAGEAGFDPLGAGLRSRIRGLIEELTEQELEAALGRGRYALGGTAAGHRHGRRARRLTGGFGPVEVAAPRARFRGEDGTTREWRSAALPRYARRTRQVEARIAGVYLAGTNTRPVGRALAALFRGALGKDVVSGTWREAKADGEAWCRRGLAGKDIVRLIVDGTAVRVRVDRKATSVSLVVVLGIRPDGQKVLLSLRDMGDGGEAAWRAVLDDLFARGLRTPAFLIFDGAAGLEKALAGPWPDVPAQRCMVPKHKNLLAHAAEQLHEVISADHTDMVHATTPQEIAPRREALLRKRRLRCRAVADNLEEAGERLFTFTRLPPSQTRNRHPAGGAACLFQHLPRRHRPAMAGKAPAPRARREVGTQTIHEEKRRTR